MQVLNKRGLRDLKSRQRAMHLLGSSNARIITARALAARIRNCVARGPAPQVTYSRMKSGTSR